MTITTEEAEMLAALLEGKSAPAGCLVTGYNFTTALRALAGERDALQARVAELEGALRQTVLLFKEILDAIDADPAETKLTLRKQGVAVKSITAAECFDKADTLLEGKKDE